jgi:hypothetical protein
MKKFLFIGFNNNIAHHYENNYDCAYLSNSIVHEEEGLDGFPIVLNGLGRELRDFVHIHLERNQA